MTIPGTVHNSLDRFLSFRLWIAQVKSSIATAAARNRFPAPACRRILVAHPRYVGGGGGLIDHTLVNVYVGLPLAT